MLRNGMLGGVSSLALFAPENGAGGGAAGAGGDDGGGTRDGGTAGGVSEGGAAAGAGGSAGGAGGTAGGDPAGAGGGSATLAGGAVDPNAAAAAAAGAKPGFPDNWRDQLAGGDAKVLEDLKKYTDPKALYGSLRELQTKMSKGELKAPSTPFPKDGDDAAKAEYRKANGLPENAEGYVEKLALPDGVVIGEAEKPLVAGFAKLAFEQGASQGEVDRAVSWFYQQQAVANTARAEADGESKTASMQQLMTDWGPADYKVNMNAMGTLLATMPEDLKNSMLTARLADGRQLGNTADFIKWAAAQAREINPAATIVAPGGDAVATIANELKTIGETYRKAVGGDAEAHRAYYGQDGKAGLEVRERELIDAQQRMSARSRAA